jgi:hypothetical protein
MYQHIKEGSRKDGASPRRAAEIAARTVNKHRREEGRTSNRRTQGTGNPNLSLENRTRDELYNLAQDRGIKGASRMRKDDLVRALRSRSRRS